MGAKSPDAETDDPATPSFRYQNSSYPGRSKTWIRYLEQAGGDAQKAFRLQAATYAEGRIKATKKKIDHLLASEAAAATDEERAALSTKVIEMRAKVRSLHAKVNALRRAGQADYDGTASTRPALDGLQQRYLDLAGGDPVKAKRLRKAPLIEGQLT